MQIINKIKIDLANRGIMPKIDAVQNDANTRGVEVLLFANGTAWEVPAETTIAVAFRKPDGTSGMYDKLPDGTSAASSDGSKVKAIFAPQVLTVPGLVRISIVFHDASLNQLATFPIMMVVEENPAADAVISDNYYNYQTLGDINAALSEIDKAMVRFDIAQELDAAQQARARNNIGAMGYTAKKALNMACYPIEMVDSLNYSQGNPDTHVTVTPGRDAGGHYLRHEGYDYDDVILRGVAEGVEDTDAVNKGQMDGALAASELTVIDKLCPAFSESGAVVTCEPVEGYPLRVVSQIDVKQSGSGDPTPENIRPFVERTAVKLTRCGKNLFGGDALADKIANSGGTKDVANGTITFHPKDTGTFTLFSSFQENTQYTFIFRGIALESTYANLRLVYTDGSATTNQFKFSASNEDGTIIVKSDAGKTVQLLQLYYYSGTTMFYYNQCGIFEGDISAEEFEPYQGNTFTMELGQSIYGGSLDWSTGVLTIGYAAKVFDGTSNTGKFISTDSDAGTYAYTNRHASGLTPKANGKIYANRATYVRLSGTAGTTIVVTIPASATGVVEGDDEATVVQKFNATAKAWYDAGTPLIAVYELATPTKVQLTPQEIKALAGVNTVFSDTGATEVTGRADPVVLNESLMARIAALEAAAVNNS